MRLDAMTARSMQSQAATTNNGANYSVMGRLIKEISIERDEHAFTEFYRGYRPQALVIATAITRNADDAADAVQEAMLRVWRAASSCRPEQVYPWLRQIVVRESFKKLKQRHVGSEECLNQIVDTTYRIEPGLRVEKRELSDRLKALVEDLSNRDQNLLALYFEGGHSQDNIASRLAVSQRTVSNRLRWILSQFRLRLRDFRTAHWTCEVASL